MLFDRILLIPLAIGHLALFVYVMNVVHGLGYSEEAMGTAKKVLLAVFFAGGLLLVWESWRAPVVAWSWPLLTYGGLCLALAGILMPISSAYLHLRPNPEVVDALCDEIDLAPEGGREALIGEGRFAGLLRLSWNDSFRLIKREWEINVPRLPAELDGLSILQFSDLHLAPCFRRAYFDRIFDELETLPADLVVFTGDLVEHDESVDWIVPLFQRLRGRIGSYAILGNHDEKHDPRRLLSALEQSGFIPLDGDWATAPTDRGRIALAGTSHPWGRKPPLAARPEADLHILLSHVPDLFYWAVRGDFDLMLSGHNHGGQIRLPLVGPVFMPSLYSRRFDRGFFRRGPLTLHVSQGIAGLHPIRYGCPPEIGRLILRTPLARRPHRPHGVEKNLALMQRTVG